MLNLSEFVKPIAEANGVSVDALIAKLMERHWDFSGLDITNETDVDFAIRVINGYAENLPKL